MPFTKTKGGKYKSTSGRLYSKRQLAMYHATNGFKNRRKK